MAQKHISKTISVEETVDPLVIWSTVWLLSPDNKTALCNGSIFESVAGEPIDRFVEAVDRFVYNLHKNEVFNAKTNRYENLLKIKLCVQHFLNENDPLNDLKI